MNTKLRFSRRLTKEFEAEALANGLYRLYRDGSYDREDCGTFRTLTECRAEIRRIKAWEIGK